MPSEPARYSPMTAPRLRWSLAAAVRTVFALSALAALWDSNSSSAQAGCGDYVTIGNGMGHAMQRESGPMGDPGMPPCHGPECSRRQPSPLPPTAPARIAVFDAWIGLTLSAGDVMSPSVLLDQATLRLPLARAPRIDRPPKAIL